MTMQQLTYVLEVYRHGSISKAAQNLYMAQPNLSTAIRELETELGSPIFRRTPRGIELTEMGESFVRDATDLVSRFHHLEQLHRPDENRLSTLSIITARSSEVCISMSEYITQLAAQGCPFRIRLRESPNYDVINDVVSGAADLGVVRTNSLDSDYFLHLISYRKLQYLQLPPVEYVVLFSKDHPLASQSYLTQELLRPYIEVVHGDYEMPMYPFSNYKYHDFQKEEREKNVVFVYDRGTLMDVLANVPGSYVWTSTTHQRLKDTYGLVERHCDAPPVTGIDTIVYDGNRPVTAEMRHFLKMLLKKVGMEDALFPEANA